MPTAQVMSRRRRASQTPLVTTGSCYAPEADDLSSGRGIAFQQTDDYVPPTWRADGNQPGRAVSRRCFTST